MSVYEALMLLADACARETGKLLEVEVDAPTWRSLLLELDTDGTHPLRLAGPVDVVIRLKGSTWSTT